MSTPETATGAPSNPEISSVPPLERALRYESVNDLWQKTKDLYYAHHTKENGWVADDEDLYNGEVAGVIQAYLSGHGLDESSDDFAKLGRRLQGLSFGTMSTRRWKYGDWVDENDHTKGLKPGTSGESRVRKLQLAFTGKDLEEEAREAASAEPEPDPDGPRTPEADAVRVELERLRQAKHDAFANKVNGPAFGKKKRALQEAYDAAEAAYLSAREADLMRRVTENFPDGFDNDSLKAFVGQHITEVAREDARLQREKVIAVGGNKARFLTWYANLNTPAKIAVTAGMGVVGGAIGFFGGAIGAGAAVLGAGLGVYRYARTYTTRLSKIYKDGTEEKEFTAGDGDVKDEALNYLKAASRNKVAEAERIKRRAVYWAVGSVAVGSALGTLAHVASDGWSPVHVPGGQAQHELANRGFRLPWDQTGVQGETPSIEDGDGAGDIDDVPDNPEAAHIDSSIYVEKGSGLIRETYQSAHTAGYDIDMKTAEALQQATREHFGDKGIIDIFDVSKDTYLHGNDLRLSAPGDAVWKDGVTDFMQQWLEEHGYSVSESVSSASEAAGASTSHVLEVAQQAIDKGDALSMNVVDAKEGWFNTFNELRDAGVVNIPQEHYADFLKDSWPDLKGLSYSDGTPVAYLTRWGEVRMYKSPDDNLLLPEAIRVLARRAAEQGYTFSTDYATQAARLSTGIQRAV